MKNFNQTKLKRSQLRITVPYLRIKSSHINVAMNLLQRKFPELGGFYKVQHGRDLTFPKESKEKGIQIIHIWLPLGRFSLRFLQ